MVLFALNTFIPVLENQTISGSNWVGNAFLLTSVEVEVVDALDTNILSGVVSLTLVLGFLSLQTVVENSISVQVKSVCAFGALENEVSSQHLVQLSAVSNGVCCGTERNWSSGWCSGSHWL